MSAADPRVTRHDSGSVVVVLPATHPSLNSWVSKRGPWERDRLKKTWGDMIAAVCLGSGLSGYRVAPRVVITITSYFKDSRARDFDNFVPKFILDGLRGHLLSDDSTSEVVELRLRHGLDRVAWRTEVLIEKEG